MAGYSMQIPWLSLKGKVLRWMKSLKKRISRFLEIPSMRFAKATRKCMLYQIQFLKDVSLLPPGLGLKTDFQVKDKFIIKYFIRYDLFW